MLSTTVKTLGLMRFARRINLQVDRQLTRRLPRRLAAAAAAARKSTGRMTAFNQQENCAAIRDGCPDARDNQQHHLDHGQNQSYDMRTNNLEQFNGVGEWDSQALMTENPFLATEASTDQLFDNSHTDGAESDAERFSDSDDEDSQPTTAQNEEAQLAAALTDDAQLGRIWQLLERAESKDKHLVDTHRSLVLQIRRSDARATKLVDKVVGLIQADDNKRQASKDVEYSQDEAEMEMRQSKALAVVVRGLCEQERQHPEGKPLRPDHSIICECAKQCGVNPSSVVSVHRVGDGNFRHSAFRKFSYNVKVIFADQGSKATFMKHFLDLPVKLRRGASSVHDALTLQQKADAQAAYRSPSDKLESLNLW